MRQADAIGDVLGSIHGIIKHLAVADFSTIEHEAQMAAKLAGSVTTLRSKCFKLAIQGNSLGWRCEVHERRQR